MTSPTIVCVLGMHRSGTSLAAGMLAQLGVYLGSERNMMAPGEDNPKGFWELDPVRDLNDEILAALGGTWDDPPSFPPRWERGRNIKPLRERARDLVRSEFEGRDRWAWKDPRASLTLPLWRRVVPRMRYVVCVRSPLEVARSLESRNGIPLGRGVELWETYSAAALRNTAGEERMVVGFEELLEGPRGAAARLGRFVGVDLRPEHDERLDTFVASELRHHATDPGDVLESDLLRPRAKALYGVLEAALDAERRAPDDRAALEAALGALVRA